MKVQSRLFQNGKSFLPVKKIKLYVSRAAIGLRPHEKTVKNIINITRLYLTVEYDGS